MGRSPHAPGAVPRTPGELYNQVAVFESDHYTPESDDWGTEAELEERFAGACRTVRDALPLVSRDRRWPLYDRLPVDDWVHGRIVLLGDAAHPMLQYLAQGACQALEDAVALGEALGRFGEPTEAFGAYAAQRTARAARVQTNARRFGEICHLEGMGATFRNLFLGAREPDDFDDISWVWTAGRTSGSRPVSTSEGGHMTTDDPAYKALETAGAAPLWRFYGNLFPAQPKSRAVPYRWSWRELRPHLLHFSETLSLDEAERRVLMLVNPGLTDPPATVNTLYAGLQIILPGETAQAHRHTSNAFRFILEGSGAWTTVDGERVFMEPGDLLLTPGWHWHDHTHEGDAPMIWLDALDYPRQRPGGRLLREVPAASPARDPPGRRGQQAVPAR